MSITAGIYYFREIESIPNDITNEIRNLISRNQNEEITVFHDKGFFAVKVDIGAFAEPGYYSAAPNQFALLTGEPLLTGGTDRQTDLIEIHNGLQTGDFSILTRAQGVFSLADYRKDKLFLVTDKLGIRPLYYFIGDGFIVFSSVLRLIEGLSLVKKKMNLKAVTQIAGLGIAVGDQTPYEGVFLLKPGQLLQVEKGNVSRLQYWHWDSIEISAKEEDFLCEELYRQFESAVIRRLRNDTATVSYLSGGLDSRCIVTLLDHLKAKVNTFNFARPNTQDQILGRNFAEQIKSNHTEIPKEPGDHIPDYSTKMAQAWSEVRSLGETSVERPSLIWSGEGGSVVLGHVHLSAKIVELMRAGDVSGAIAEYISRESIYIAPKLFKKDVFIKLSPVIKEEIAGEINSFRAKDPARNFYLFLLLNDQRRKLSKHFENMDLHRLEFQLPFFDSSFIETILSLPVDLCLRHQLYVKWLYLFPKVAVSAPWQAYPGHAPCPLPIPAGLSYQWDTKYQGSEQKSLKQKLIKEGKEIINSEDFPDQILSKNNIRLAIFVHQTGWRDYGYIIEYAQLYQKYWRICRGDYTF